MKKILSDGITLSSKVVNTHFRTQKPAVPSDNGLPIEAVSLSHRKKMWLIACINYKTLGQRVLTNNRGVGTQSMPDDLETKNQPRSPS